MGFFRPDDQVTLVTSAGVSRAADLSHRRTSYAVMMAVRTLCVVLAVALPVPVWARLAIMAGGVFLPLLAVTTANTTGATDHRAASLFDADAVVRPALSATASGEPRRHAVVIDGVTVEEFDRPDIPAPSWRAPAIVLDGEVVARSEG